MSWCLMFYFYNIVIQYSRYQELPIAPLCNTVQNSYAKRCKMLTWLYFANTGVTHVMIIVLAEIHWYWQHISMWTVTLSCMSPVSPVSDMWRHQVVVTGHRFQYRWLQKYLLFNNIGMKIFDQIETNVISFPIPCRELLSYRIMGQYFWSTLWNV